MITKRIVTVDVPERGAGLKLSRVVSITSEVERELASRISPEFEFFYVTANELHVETDGTEDVIKKGEILFNYPGQTFGIRPAKRPTSYLHCHFDFRAATVKKLVSGLEDWASLASRMDAWTSGFSRILHLPDRLLIRNSTLLLETIQRLVNFQRGTAPGYAVAAEAQFLIFLHYVSQETIRTITHSAEPRDCSSSGLLVARALDYIERKMSDPISLHEVASHLEINPQYLSRIFKTQTGLSVGAYILRRKIAVAKERLLSTRLNIKQIAMSVGFRDSRYFSRRFHGEIGMSPRAYQLSNN